MRKEPEKFSAMARVTKGAQFTLYLKTNPRTGQYDAKQVHCLKSFVAQCERTLQEAGIAPGEIPGSDVSIGHHASYRNENYYRGISHAEKNESLAQEPMFRLLRGLE